MGASSLGAPSGCARWDEREMPEVTDLLALVTVDRKIPNGWSLDILRRSCDTRAVCGLGPWMTIR